MSFPAKGFQKDYVPFVDPTDAWKCHPPASPKSWRAGIPGKRFRLWDDCAYNVRRNRARASTASISKTSDRVLRFAALLCGQSAQAHFQNCHHFSPPGSLERMVTTGRGLHQSGSDSY